LLNGIRWGAGWCLRRRPRTHGGLIQTRALVDRPSDQSIVMSAGKQIGQASKQENEQCGSNPPKGVPQANSHNTWALVSQGGHLWPIAHWEQRYATSPPPPPHLFRCYPFCIRMVEKNSYPPTPCPVVVPGHDHGQLGYETTSDISASKYNIQPLLLRNMMLPKLT